MNKADLEQLYENKDKRFKMQRWVTLEEAKVIHSIVEEEAPNHIFESSTANGYSACWLGLSGCPVTTYDPVDRLKVWEDDNPPHITYVQAEFKDVVTHASKVSGKLLFFIDGIHKDYGLREDLSAVLEIIKPGDVIVFHDVHHINPGNHYRKLKTYSASYKDYDTKRGIGKVVWGTMKGELYERTSEV